MASRAYRVTLPTGLALLAQFVARLCPPRAPLVTGRAGLGRVPGAHFVGEVPERLDAHSRLDASSEAVLERIL